MNTLRSQRGLVSAWLIKVILGLAVSGVVLFDAGSILVNRLSAGASAEDVANSAASDVMYGGVVTQAAVAHAAQRLADDFGVKLLEATLDRHGVVHVEVRKKARTFVAGSIGPLRDWVRAEGRARSRTK